MRERTGTPKSGRGPALGLTLIGFLLPTCTTVVDQPPVPVRRSSCTPTSAGKEVASGEAVSIPGVVLPANCRISEDDSEAALARRSVSVITNEEELRVACKLEDTSPIRGLVDFSRDLLVLVRIPDSTSPRWAVRTSTIITIGESTTECSGVEAKPFRYVVKIPVTTTTTFFLCDPLGCEEEP